MKSFTLTTMTNTTMTTPFKLDERKITILYGSATGNAIDVSERIAFELQRKWFNIRLMSMNEYLFTIKQFNANHPFPDDRLIIFVASTTGQGDVPNNMKNFWKFLLRRDLPKHAFSKLQFTTFGLGDSSYINYNTVTRKLHQRLLDLGAIKVFDRGLGDDQHDIGYDSAFIPWLESLSDTLQTMYGIPDGLQIMDKNKLVPSKYSIQHLSATTHDDDDASNDDKQQKYYAPLLKHIRLTPSDHWQDVRQLTFDITCSDLVYKPGDVLLLYPCNPQSEIKTLCDILGIKDMGKNTFISIHYNESSDISICKNLSDDLVGLIPHRLSVYDLFEKYLDICGVPRRTFFEYLVHFAQNEQHKEKLIQFCSNNSEGQIALYEYNQAESRTFIEVLQDFNSCDIPLQYLVSLIPKLKSRKFSICSALEYYFEDQNCIDNEIKVVRYADKKRKLVEITVALVEYETPLKRKRKGLCSRYIASIPVIGGRSNEDQKETDDEVKDVRVPIWIEKGSFRFKDGWLNSHVLMIGPGTGIAPFRSMCQFRYYLMNNVDEKQTVANCLVLFGNRNCDKDFFYKTEWDKLQNKEGVIDRQASVFKLITAFSRDQPRKVYVTDKIKENEELIWNWISDKKCCILVAGSASKMPNDVRNAIIDIVGKYGGKNKKDAQNIVKRLERTRRYQSETWS
eukprot:539387_1